MTECVYCKAKEPLNYGLCKNCLDNINFDVKFNRNLAYVDEIIVACEYKSLIKEIIIDFKFKDKTHYYKTLADIMTEKLLKERIINNYKYISFVPMHKKDLKKRSYNQAELLARQIADNSFLKLINPIKKAIYTDQQIKMNDPSDRQKNIAGAFSLEKSIDGNIIIVDDVITSGATLNELGKIIKKDNKIKVAALLAATPSYS
jgi:competence protein ComFC